MSVTSRATIYIADPYRTAVLALKKRTMSTVRASTDRDFSQDLPPDFSKGA